MQNVHFLYSQNARIYIKMSFISFNENKNAMHFIHIKDIREVKVYICSTFEK